jgi:hypothetical protein
MPSPRNWQWFTCQPSNCSYSEEVPNELFAVLVATIFQRDYLPRAIAGDRLGRSGAFVVG